MTKKPKPAAIETAIPPAEPRTQAELFPITGMTKEEEEILKGGKIPIDEPTSTEHAIAKLMGNMVLDISDRRKLMSDLSPRDVHLFSVSYARAWLFKNEILVKFLDEELMLRVSRKRAGRGEIIKLAGAIREQEMKRSWWRRLSLGGQQGMSGGI